MLLPGKNALQAGFKWAAYAEDLIVFLENQQAQAYFHRGVTIVHYLGAKVTAMAALKQS